ncbi:cupin domain-containing protein [Epilithonimonas sp.]|uniref:cupin domain-containing protein n=1 Tax=Epilithonimonas sp. TaxID=2894511 RepID=UPI00289D0AFA|nr:cupin domain-containing protein [Epilithonimonas sp.]
MKRRRFIQLSSLGIAAMPFFSITGILNLENMEVKTFYFKDDGIIPNSKFPLLVYKNAFSERGNSGADFLEKKFRDHNWYNSWRWGVYPFHHYHSVSHEVLGVFQGTALLHMGDPNGEKLNVEAGDILIIPAGVGHKCISHSEDFTVVGAYPNGMDYDLVKEEKSKHAQSVKNIQKVSFPSDDPLLGKTGGIKKYWK